MTAHVRDATVADAVGIARVRIETWRAAYSGLVPKEVLDRLDVERETAHRVERWDEHHADAGSHDLVAVADGEVVGWASAGRAREVLDGVTGELYAIYLEGYQYFHMGYAAALTLIFLAFVLLFSILQIFVLERRVHYG